MPETKFGWRRDNSFSAPNTPSKDSPVDGFKVGPAADQPATQPAKAPAEVTPTRKS